MHLEPHYAVRLRMTLSNGPRPNPAFKARAHSADLTDSEVAGTLDNLSVVWHLLPRPPAPHTHDGRDKKGTE